MDGTLTQWFYKYRKELSLRSSIKEFIQICIETLPLSDPIYEFGSFLVPGQEEMINLRSMFTDRDYVGADFRKGPGVDIVLDLHNIHLSDDVVGTVLLIDTIEHVEFVRKAINEVNRILKPNGILIMSSVMDFPIHGYPNDYWRFTPLAFESLLSPFESSFVSALGRKNFPHTLVGVGFKSALPEDTMKVFLARTEAWSKQWRWQIFFGWKECIRRLLPPFILEWYMDRCMTRAQKTKS
ncbi:methyltransferase domain-containing protein [Thermodesulfobacteriota bacterium]